jgi:hypothetical protein
MNEQSASINGGRQLMFYREHMLGERLIQTKAVQQSDGTFWMYSRDAGKGWGVPIRGAKRQAQIKRFCAEVEAALK